MRKSFISTNVQFCDAAWEDIADGTWFFGSLPGKDIDGQRLLYKVDNELLLLVNANRLVFSKDLKEGTFGGFRVVDVRIDAC